MLHSDSSVVSAEPQDLGDGCYPCIKVDAARFGIDSRIEFDLHFEPGFCGSLTQYSHGVSDIGASELNQWHQLQGFMGWHDIRLHLHALCVDDDGASFCGAFYDTEPVPFLTVMSQT